MVQVKISSSGVWCRTKEISRKSPGNRYWVPLHLYILYIHEPPVSKLFVSLKCNDCIAAALAASKILKKLARVDGDHGEQAESMRELADHYENQAIGEEVFI